MRLDARRAIEDRDEAKLEALARLDPDALNGLHGRLLDADLLRPALAYRTADPSTRDRLLARVHRFADLSPDRRSADSLELAHALTALAWIGDDAVQAAFARWRAQPPTWATALYIAPHAYTTTAGWTLARDGTRRDLYLPTGRTLVRAEHASGPVRVLETTDGHCRFCSNPLGTLFELDLRAPELAFLPLTGPAFPIPFCHLCSAYGPITFRIDASGRPAWHERTARFPVHDDTFDRWDDYQFALGRPLANPFEYAGWIDDDVGHVGGYPGWIDDATYPPCLDCREPMTFIGQVDVASGGRFYGLACLACRTASSVYQQT